MCDATRFVLKRAHYIIIIGPTAARSRPIAAGLTCCPSLAVPLLALPPPPPSDVGQIDLAVQHAAFASEPMATAFFEESWNCAASQVTEAPAHLVASTSQQVEAQLLASPVHSVVSVTDDFFLYPAAHVAAEQVAFAVQQAAFASEPMATALFEESWNFPTSHVTTLLAHTASSVSQQPHALAVGHKSSLSFMPAEQENPRQLSGITVRIAMITVERIMPIVAKCLRNVQVLGVLEAAIGDWKRFNE
jgi:hypothetical protein